MTEDCVISYQAATRGTPVLTRAGERIGKLEHVLQDPQLDLFDGLVIHTHHGLRFVDANQVERITKISIRTSLTEEQVADLPQPDGPPVYEIDALAVIDQDLNATLMRLFNRPYGFASGPSSSPVNPVT
jgi:hypothetical protein